jgi:hypothetical protein
LWLYLSNLKNVVMQKNIKKVWGKPQINRLSVKNFTLSGTKGDPDENPKSQNANKRPAPAS